MVDIRYYGRCVLCGGDLDNSSAICKKCTEYASMSGASYIEETCSFCGGRGKFYNSSSSNNTNKDYNPFIEATCPHCNGMGKVWTLYKYGGV